MPARACRSSRRTSCRNVVGRASPPGGTVASHGTSQAALPRRAVRQACASAYVSGRSVTSPWRRGAGHPGACSMVAPHDLLDGVHEDRREHREAVLHPAARAGQVDDEAAADHARPRRARARRSGRPSRRRTPGSPRRCPGTSKSSSGRVTSGVRSVGVRPVPPVVSTTRAPAATAARDGGADRFAVGHDDRGADREAERPQELDEQRAGRVLVDPGGGAVGGHDDRAGGTTSSVTGITGSSPPTCRRSSSRPGRR